MKKLIVLLPLITLGLSGQANAQTLNQISGTWSISRNGQDVDNLTAQQLGKTLKWIIKESDGTLSIDWYYLFPAGFVNNSEMTVTRIDYEDGKLTMTAQPKINNEIFPMVSIYYEIVFAANGREASGTYVEVTHTIGQKYNFFTKTFEPAPDVKKYGKLTMSRLSKSNAPPKAKSRPTANASAPAFVPPMNFLAPSGGSIPSPSPRSHVDCSVEYNSCWHSCDSAPCFGSCDTNRMEACNARCEAARNRCQMR